jgi:hypothetical protein
VNQPQGEPTEVVQVLNLQEEPSSPSKVLLLQFLLKSEVQLSIPLRLEQVLKARVGPRLLFPSLTPGMA